MYDESTSTAMFTPEQQLPQLSKQVDNIRSLLEKHVKDTPWSM